MVTVFAEMLERVCIETVESGNLTKDLALLVGPQQPSSPPGSSWRRWTKTWLALAAEPVVPVW